MARARVGRRGGDGVSTRMRVYLVEASPKTEKSTLERLPYVYMVVELDPDTFENINHGEPREHIRDEFRMGGGRRG